MSYQIKKGEQGYIHAEIQKGGFDPNTGKPIGKPYVHVTTGQEFNMFLKNRMGNKILKIHHVPDGYELPKPADIDKEEASKAEKKAYKLAMKDYNHLKSLLPTSSKSGGGTDDSPEATRLKELKALTVPDIDSILEGHGLPVEGNKTVKIQAVIDHEFPKS